MPIETKDITCIRCPLGCSLRVSVAISAADAEVVGVEGNQCARGSRYGAEEAVHPMRTVTACVCVPGALEPVSAKTVALVEKSRVRDVARAISSLTVSLPVHAGDVLSEDVAETGRGGDQGRGLLDRFPASLLRCLRRVRAEGRVAAARPSSVRA